jgi:hypothetical protein
MFLQDPLIEERVTNYAAQLGVGPLVLQLGVSSAVAMIVLAFHLLRRHAGPERSNLKSEQADSKKTHPNPFRTTGARYLHAAKNTSILSASYMAFGAFGANTGSLNSVIYMFAILIFFLSTISYLVMLPIVQRRRNAALQSLYREGQFTLDRNIPPMALFALFRYRSLWSTSSFVAPPRSQLSRMV